MASAILPSRNESSWGHMGDIPFSNSHLNANPKPKKKQRQFQHTTGKGLVGFYANNNIESPAVIQTVSDDAYSFNQTSTSRNALNYGNYLTFNVSSYTKSELIVLRKRLSAELDLIRGLRDQIETSQFSSVGNPRSQTKSKKSSENQPTGVQSTSVKESTRFASGVDDPYDGFENTLNFEGLMKECKQILTRLLKHKSGWIFKTPVDAVALGLHDYHQIVKRPMDLGTVKASLAKTLYRSPVEFAADVRLTFNNALLYNPKTDPVNGIAEEMLSRFEESFTPIQEKIDKYFTTLRRERELREFSLNHEKRIEVREELHGASWNTPKQILASPPFSGKRENPKASPTHISHVSKKHDRMNIPVLAHSTASTASSPPHPSKNHLPTSEKISSPVGAPYLPAREPKVGRGAGTNKLPKPRAKDQNKRDMSMEEKQKLGMGLQNLPQEKMPQLVHIIRKRNRHLAQDGDEIELDIEAIDTETLWELDRFVTNWKKMVSKIKRQTLMNNNYPAAGVAPLTDLNVGGVEDEMDGSAKKLKENDDEDVDIEDDMPATSFPPVEIEKDDGAGGGHDLNHDRDTTSESSSSSSSSGSDSSSSSDSESGSSSGSDSDAADDAQS